MTTAHRRLPYLLLPRLPCCPQSTSAVRGQCWDSDPLVTKRSQARVPVGGIRVPQRLGPDAALLRGMVLRKVTVSRP